MASTRRLAAILAADVTGYSRLMGQDEEGTHARLRAHLRELVDPKIAEHRGRIVKNTGDGMLAEFSSIVDAVRCAAEVQRAMADRNAMTPVPASSQPQLAGKPRFRHCTAVARFPPKPTLTPSIRPRSSSRRPPRSQSRHRDHRPPGNYTGQRIRYPNRRSVKSP